MHGLENATNLLKSYETDAAKRVAESQALCAAKESEVKKLEKNLKERGEWKAAEEALEKNARDVARQNEVEGNGILKALTEEKKAGESLKQEASRREKILQGEIPDALQAAQTFQHLAITRP